ncbi:hypothetical protein H5410_010352 [Solanum commersonii]|uniref:Uncharacterized protein n=1 Tax=Solanum commersonii TaxID=4109 RepID=A0A9J6AKH4_SOLCO|nr:hypothetical protein H5410_010352 [Solanum commersonii]
MATLGNNKIDPAIDRVRFTGDRSSLISTRFYDTHNWNAIHFLLLRSSSAMSGHISVTEDLNYQASVACNFGMYIQVTSHNHSDLSLRFNPVGTFHTKSAWARKQEPRWESMLRYWEWAILDCSFGNFDFPPAIING